MRPAYLPLPPRPWLTLACLTLLILISAPLAHAQTVTEEWGSDRRGDDYDSFRSSDLDRCKEACEGDRRCQAYTFNTRTRTCYLKDGPGLNSSNRDTVSGTKVAGNGAGRPPRGDEEEFTEMRGYDHRGGDYDSFRAASPEACLQRCREDRRCLAYTFNTRSGECYLKERVNPVDRDGATVTGRRKNVEAPGVAGRPGWEGGWPGGDRPGQGEVLSEERGYDYRGGDYDSFRARSLETCQAECRRDRRCVAYSFNTRSDLCYLKESVGNRERNGDTITGVKERGDRPGAGHGGGHGGGSGGWHGGGRDRLSEEVGYDYRGGDYHSFRAPRVEDCKRQCARDERCEAYTFNTASEICYLKDRVGNLERNRDTITGTRGGGAGGGRLSEEWGYDYRGGDYDSFSAPDLAACKSGCRQDRRCIAYTFNTSRQTCYLKDRVGNLERNRDTVTGVREGADGSDPWP